MRIDEWEGQKGDPELAKIWAIYLGIKIKSSLQIKKIEIETDSCYMANFLSIAQNDLHPLYTMFMNYKSLLSTFEESKITKILRGQNNCADFLTFL